MKEEKLKNPTLRTIRNIIVSVFLLGLVAFIFMCAPDYVKDEYEDKINFIINNNNVTGNLKNDLYVDENGVVYVSRQDLANFFDKYIYYDEKYNQIITTGDTTVATFVMDKNEMTINSKTEKILGSFVEKDEIYYLPFSEMEEIYNMEVNYIKETERVVVTTISRKLEETKATEKLSIKLKAKDLSRTVEKVEQGDKLVVISSNNGWTKVRTESGLIGYVKEEKLGEIVVAREETKLDTKLEGKVSLIWDYYSQYVSAPNRNGESTKGYNVVSPSMFMLERLGKGDIYDNAKSGGQQYVKWAKDNNLKVWAMFSNDSMIETTHEILIDYKLREKTINGIVDLAVKYDLDGINLDFENMYEGDKDYYTRFVAELYPRLREKGMNLSVDVTAPDGSPTWSLCFDRYAISENSDYIMFMAYDQYGVSSTSAGTTAGYDWVSVNLNKFIRDIPVEKIVLGIPFYTRLWKEKDGVTEMPPAVVNMKSISNVVPQTATVIWDNNLRQNYAEYMRDGKLNKIWIEDEKSITEKLNLAVENKLGGVAFWAKDREEQSIWNVVYEKILSEK